MKTSKSIRFWLSRNEVMFGKLLRIALYLLAMGIFIEYSYDESEGFTAYQGAYFFVWLNLIKRIL